MQVVWSRPSLDLCERWLFDAASVRLPRIFNFENLIFLIKLSVSFFFSPTHHSFDAATTLYDVGY
jgi:hypothetical protein